MPNLALVAVVVAAGAAFVPIAPAQRILGLDRGAGHDHRLGAAVAALGDLDADGVGDYAVSSIGNGGGAPYVVVYSGRRHSVLRRIVPAVGGSEWGTTVAGLGDVNGDGVPDLAVGQPRRQVGSSMGVIELYSGRDGAVLAMLSESSGNFTELGWHLLGVDDVDADRVPDFVATAPNVRQVRVYSGRSRALLRTLTPVSGSAISLALLGDLNGDGSRELIVGDPAFNQTAGRVLVFDLRTGATLRTLSDAGAFGTAVAGVGDLDGDGVPDLAAGAPNTQDAGGNTVGAVRAYSGRTSVLLWVATGRRDAGLGSTLTGLGDVDGDGVPDLAVASPYARGPLGSEQGLVAFVSGRTGAILMHMDGLAPSGRFGAALAGLDDVDADGIPDLLVGAPAEMETSWQQGAVRVLSGRILADAVLEGTGCGGGPFLPLLGGTRPIVGTTAQLVGEWAPPVPGFLLLSPPPARPFNLGVPACHAYVDLATAVLLAPIPPGTGRWSLPLPIPGAPGFPGLALSFQVIYGPTLGPLGFDLTGGVRWRIGW